MATLNSRHGGRALHPGSDSISLSLFSDRNFTGTLSKSSPAYQRKGSTLHTPCTETSRAQPIHPPCFVRSFLPVVELETWSPVWRLQDCLHSTSKVREAVTHEEKHRDDWSDIIDVRQQNTRLRNRRGQEEGTSRFTRLRRHCKRS